MEQVLINSLKLENISRLSIEEKHKVIKELHTKLSLREIAKKVGVPYATIQDWYSLRQREKAGQLSISIDRLIEHFTDYKPRLKDYDKIEKLIKILEDIIKIK